MRTLLLIGAGVAAYMAYRYYNSSYRKSNEMTENGVPKWIDDIWNGTTPPADPPVPQVLPVATVSPMVISSGTSTKPAIPIPTTYVPPSQPVYTAPTPIVQPVYAPVISKAEYLTSVDRLEQMAGLGFIFS